jgi:hypothetical protein
MWGGPQCWTRHNAAARPGFVRVEPPLHGACGVFVVGGPDPGKQSLGLASQALGPGAWGVGCHLGLSVVLMYGSWVRDSGSRCGNHPRPHGGERTPKAPKRFPRARGVVWISFRLAEPATWVQIPPGPLDFAALVACPRVLRLAALGDLRSSLVLASGTLGPFGTAVRHPSGRPMWAAVAHVPLAPAATSSGRRGRRPRGRGRTGVRAWWLPAARP